MNVKEKYNICLNSIEKSYFEKIKEKIVKCFSYFTWCCGKMNG